jgi:carbon-monoxide dehydrogenase large subunit
MTVKQGGMGASVARWEDERFLTGKGRFTDDHRFAGEARAVALRSPHAHGRILSLDAAAARALPGVLAVLTGREVAADGLGLLPCLRPMQNRDGGPMFQPPHPLLSGEFVRYVGDPVALVVAETEAIARDGAELVEIDYQALPAATSLRQVRDGSAPDIRSECPGNHCYHHEMGDQAATDQAFAQAHRVVEREMVISRVQASPMEPRSAVGLWDLASGYTLTTGLQSTHRARDVLADHLFKVPKDQVRVIGPDLGGAFGNRNTLYNEYALVLWAAKRLGRPVKWTAQRSEAFLCDDQGRDNIATAALALDRDGRFLGLRVRNAAALGAYLSTMGPAPTVNNLGCLAGVYRTPAIFVEVDGYFTNTNPTSAYRGAGRPEAIYILERLIDEAAREIGVDRIELRRRNLIAPEALPFKTPLTFTYDSGDFPGNMDRCLDLIDYHGFEARRAAARDAGLLLGLGIANAIESAGSPARSETARLSLDGDGRARLVAGTLSHGQGHETVYRQLLAETLGLDYGAVEMVQGDTLTVPFGAGTFGSRSITLGGGALKAAAEIVLEQARRVAADHFEASEQDIVFELGDFVVAGTDRRMTLKTVARLAVERGEPLDGESDYAPEAATFPNGCHACEVTIDPETGETKLLRYVVVDDFGRVINPLLLEGQVHGGVVQGIGQILSEEIVHDGQSGQLLSGSFMDYAMPRARDIPFFEFASNPHPTAKNTLGVKGVGEAGTVGALACTMSAVLDALAPEGVRDLDMPATAERVWRALQAAKDLETQSV